MRQVLEATAEEVAKFGGKDQKKEESTSPPPPPSSATTETVVSPKVEVLGAKSLGFIIKPAA
jgi:hypothetical protein